MIARHKTFPLAQRRGEDSFVGVISAVGKKLQRQKWVRGSAFAQIDLDRIRLPLTTRLTHCNKVDREPAHHPFTCETCANFRGLAHDRGTVARIGGKATSKISLARRATQNLIMSREFLNLAQRSDTKLRAGTAKLFTDNSLFHDAAALIQ